MTRRARRGRSAPARGKRAQPRRERELAEWQAREIRLKRYRTVAGFLGLVPLAGSFACDAGVALLCVPWSWYMAVWAAVFGAFIGLSIRLIRERRQFEAQHPRAG
ncbi:MAG TPA: hypothetical protein VL333_12160 [Candidatus Saccharimonadales bacterium]|jgi:hypothetical protein|nr:hypothetical protein [Candidatus Saccharimonadales bacterium]